MVCVLADLRVVRKLRWGCGAKTKKNIFFSFFTKVEIGTACGIHKGKGSVLQGDPAESVAVLPTEKKGLGPAMLF